MSWRSRPRCQSFSLTAAVSFLLRWFPLLRTIILWDDCAHLIPVLALLSSEGPKELFFFFPFAQLLCSASDLVVVVVTVFSCSVITNTTMRLSIQTLLFLSPSLSAAPSGFASWLIWLPPPPLYCHRLCHPQPGPRVPKPSKPLPLQLYTMWCDAPILSRVSPFWFHSTIDILTLANRDRAQSMLRLEEIKKQDGRERGGNGESKKHRWKNGSSGKEEQKTAIVSARRKKK